MSELSEKLDKYIAESGLNVSRISRLTGIERTKILRLKNGKGNVTDRELHQILDLLQLSQEEEDYMVQLHQMDEVGKDTYEARAMIRELVEKIGKMRKSWACMQSLDDTLVRVILPDEREKSTLLLEKMDIADAISYALRKEICENEEATIHMDMFPGCESVLKNLIRLERNCTHKISCVQYVRFLKNTREGAGVHNLEILQSIVPFVFTFHNSYQVKYTYAASADDNYGRLFPHFLLTHSCVLLFSEKADRLLLIEEEKLAAQYYEECLQLEKKYKNLLKAVDKGVESMIAYYARNVFVFGPEYILESNPCVAFMIYPELLEKEKDNLYLQQLYRYVLTVFEQEKAPCTDYFGWTPEMDDFLKTGRLPGMYGKYSRAFLPDERRKMLEHYIEFFERQENKQCCLVRNLGMDEGINIELYPDNKLSFHSVSDKYPMCIAMLDENGLCEIFRDYFESLKNSAEICTWEETKAFLNDKIRGIGDQADCPETKNSLSGAITYSVPEESERQPAVIEKSEKVSPGSPGGGITEYKK